ncbi:MAG: ABC transporter permease, partial [Pseudonocardia sp.]
MTELASRGTGIRPGPWLEFAVRRTARLLVSVLVLVTVAFAMIHLIPGDPVRAALGMNASPQLVQERTHALGLDRPIPVQYVDYLWGVLRGDLGTSTVSGLPVADVVGDRLPATLSLGAAAFVVIMVVALPLGTA